MDRKILSNDQPKNMTLTANQELTNQTTLPREIIQDVKSKFFTDEWTQAIKWNSKNFILIEKTNKCVFTDLKMERKYFHI